MKLFLMIFNIVLLLSFNTFAQSNKASDSNTFYYSDGYNLSNTFMKFTDEYLLLDRDLLDDYISLNLCEEKGELFYDEIAREDFRNVLRKDLLEKIDQQPHLYRLVKVIDIDKYDFENEKLILDENSLFKNVTVIEMPTGKISYKCDYDKSKNENFEKDYYVDLGGRIDLEELEMPLNYARRILPYLKKSDNEKMFFYMIVDVNIKGIISNTSENIVFSGDVLDVGYYRNLGNRNRFGGYNFVKENERIRKDLLEKLDFVIDPDKATY